MDKIRSWVLVSQLLHACSARSAWEGSWSPWKWKKPSPKASCQLNSGRERETGLHPGAEAILNCYVPVNRKAVTLSPFPYNSLLMDWEGFIPPSNLSTFLYSAAFIGRAAGEAALQEAGKHSVRLACNTWAKASFYCDSLFRRCSAGAVW